MASKDKKFKVVIPAQIEKSESGDWRVYGLASTANKDLQNEKVNLKGLDLSPIEKGKGIFNYDHKKGPENTVGVIDTYKKDDSGLYLGGYLFKEHDRAKSLYQIMGSLGKSDRGRMGMSIEGVIKQRTGNDGKTINKAMIHSCAFTMSPVNTDTFVSLVKSLNGAEVEFEGNEIGTDFSPSEEDAEAAQEKGLFTADQVVDLIQKAIELEKGRGKDLKPRRKRGSGDLQHRKLSDSEKKESAKLRGEFVAHMDKYKDYKHNPSNPHPDYEKDRKANAERAERLDEIHYKVEKALGVGGEYASTTPSERSGGAALAQEDLDSKVKKAEYSEKMCKKCKKSQCKCAESMKKGSAEFYKSELLNVLEKLQELHPEVPKTALWEAFKERLNRRFEGLDLD